MLVSRKNSGSVGFGAGGNGGCPVVSFVTGCGGTGAVGFVCCATPGCVNILISSNAMLAAPCISLNLTIRSPTSLMLRRRNPFRLGSLPDSRVHRPASTPPDHAGSVVQTRFFNSYSDAQYLP